MRKRLATRLLVLFGAALLLGAVILVRPACALMRARIQYPPVISYHQVLADEDYVDGPNPVISRSEFEAECKYLHDMGIRTLSIEEYAEAIKSRKPPRDAVLLTFDDGYETLYTIVQPMLEKYDLKAVAFVIAGRVGKSNTKNPKQPWLTWQQCRDLQASGRVSVQAHSFDGHHEVPGKVAFFRHDGPFYSTRIVDPDSGTHESEEDYSQRIYKDMLKCRNTIEAELGNHVFALAWPYADSNSEALRAARDAGFEITFALDKRSTRGDRNRFEAPRNWEFVIKHLESSEERSAASRTGPVANFAVAHPPGPRDSFDPGLLLGILAGALLLAWICVIVRQRPSEDDKAALSDV